MCRLILLVLFTFFTTWCCETDLRAEKPLTLATFDVDASPPLQSPVAFALAKEITDPLSARGIVLRGSGPPIVICAVDFLGIGNSGYDQWRERLAEAAGTTADRVALHALHQHDGPRCDFAVAEVLAGYGMSGERFDVEFCRQLMDRVATEVARVCQEEQQPITHVGLGQAKVEKIASNRRVLGQDGEVSIVRYSRTTDPKAIAAPEGVIDPWLKSVTFWNEDTPVAILTYYATHPQSYYGDGEVTSEFVGLARDARQESLQVPHIHFTGASGNVAAGKYNDGSREMRPVLTQRLAAAMKTAWQDSQRQKLSAKDMDWKVVPVKLPPAEYLKRDRILAVLQDGNADSRAKLSAATDLVWLDRCNSERPIELSCLRLGNAYLLHLPGELFVEYQLAAQAMRPDAFVATAAYGEYSPGYIGTAISYSQGGYEVQEGVSRVSADAEQILIDGIQQLVTESAATPQPPSQIVVDGKFEDWSKVPSRFDPLYDTHDTAHSAAEDEPHYVDHRDVDLLEYKATNDDENIYFYFRSRGKIGRTQPESPGKRAGRYYAIVTIDVDRDDATGYNLHEGGYYPTTDGYDVNAEIEFFDGSHNTAHYLNQAADDSESLALAFQEQSRGRFINNRDGPYPAGTIALRHGHYDFYTQWVYHADDTITFVRDKGPIVTGIATAKTSADGHQLEACFPLKGFLPTKSGKLLITPGDTVDLSFSLEASGELAAGQDWASDTAQPYTFKLSPASRR